MLRSWLERQTPGLSASSRKAYASSKASMTQMMVSLLAALGCVAIGYMLHPPSRCESSVLRPFSSAMVPRTFELNASFVEAPSPHTDAAWEELVPRGRGFVAVDDEGVPTRFQSVSTAELSQIRTVSVFHQLHCLNELRIGYYAMARAAEAETAATDRSSGHHHSPAHMKHCFDYLRQALMCAADTTLERLQGIGSSAPAVNGWGATHQCRDFRQLFQWSEDHRATDEGGIL